MDVKHENAGAATTTIDDMSPGDTFCCDTSGAPFNKDDYRLYIVADEENDKGVLCIDLEDGFPLYFKGTDTVMPVKARVVVG